MEVKKGLVKVKIENKNYGRFFGFQIFITPQVKRKLERIKSRHGNLFNSLRIVGFQGGKHLLEILGSKLGKKFILILSHEQSRIKNKVVTINYDNFNKVSRRKFFALYRETGLASAVAFSNQYLGQAVPPPSEVITKKETEKVISALPIVAKKISNERTGELVEKVAQIIREAKIDKRRLKPSTLKELQAATNQAYYRQKIQELEKRIDKKYPEIKGEYSWQSWIYANTWLFGPNYLEAIEKKKVGFDQIPDFLFPTIDGFLDILEIKTPDKDILNEDKDHPGAFYWSNDVSKVIGQVVNYLYQIELHQLELEKKLKMSTIKPRAIILVGKSSDWTDNQKEAFRKLNFALHGLEVITYNYLLERGRQLVAIYDKPK